MENVLIPFELFTYPLYDLNYATDPKKIASAFLDTADSQSGGTKSLYIHVPFCDTICSFCPFVKSVGTRERIETYLETVIRELRIVGSRRRIANEWMLDSIAFGGGTPSILDVDQLEVLFAAIKENFQVRSGAEISFEFEAKSVDDDKFAALAQLGTTRVSFGAQTFNPATRKIAHLTATLDQIYRAIDGAAKHISSTYMDMLVGLPGQDHEDAIRDAWLAANSGIGGVTLYPVDYLQTLPSWQDRIRRGDLPRPRTLDERGEMFHAARAELQCHMDEQNIYYFGGPAPLSGGYHDEMVGVGPGAYSYIRGLVYYNESHEQEYIRQVMDGAQPVAFASPGHAYERSLVYFPMNLTYDLAELDEFDLHSSYDERIENLVESGLAEAEGNTLRLTDAGKRAHGEIMVGLLPGPQRRLYDRACKRMRREIGLIDDHEWVAGERRVRSIGARNALPFAGNRERPARPTSAVSPAG